MGPALCLLSAACFGAMAIFGKLAYTTGVTTSELLLVRFGLAAILLIALDTATSAARERTPAARPVARPTSRPRLSHVLVAVLGLGAVGYAAQASLFFGALTHLDASLVAVLFYTHPALVTLAAALLGRERLTPTRAVALGLASVGVLLVVLGSGSLSFSVVGVAMALGTAATYTGYILVSDRVIPHLPPLRLSSLVMLGAAGTMAVVNLLGGGLHLSFSAESWLWLTCIAVVSTVIAMVTFFAGMRRTGPSSAAILSTFEPVVTAALAAVILSEVLTAQQPLGSAVVLASVVVLQLRPRRRADRPTGGRTAYPEGAERVSALPRPRDDAAARATVPR